MYVKEKILGGHMPLPQRRSIWRIDKINLKVEWLYGRAVEKEDGIVKKVVISVDKNARLMDYQERLANNNFAYFDSYKEAANEYKGLLLDKAEQIERLWKRARKFEHSVGIPKAMIVW